jgi:hypothetical protein
MSVQIARVSSRAAIFLEAPDVIRDARLRRWCHAKDLMDATEVVLHEV